MALSLKDWRKLPDEKKGRRYKELSDHDKVLARISSPLGGEVTGHQEFTEEEKKQADKEFDEILRHFKVM